MDKHLCMPIYFLPLNNNLRFIFKNQFYENALSIGLYRSVCLY